MGFWPYTHQGTSVAPPVGRSSQGGLASSNLPGALQRWRRPTPLPGSVQPPRCHRSPPGHHPVTHWSDCGSWDLINMLDTSKYIPLSGISLEYHALEYEDHGEYMGILVAPP